MNIAEIYLGTRVVTRCFLIEKPSGPARLHVVLTAIDFVEYRLLLCSGTHAKLLTCYSYMMATIGFLGDLSQCCAVVHQ